MRPIDAEHLVELIEKSLEMPVNCEYHEGFESALRAMLSVIALEPTLTSPNEWISVKERLPEPPEEGEN